jgi:hypothetical protein
MKVHLKWIVVLPVKLSMGNNCNKTSEIYDYFCSLNIQIEGEKLISF